MPTDAVSLERRFSSAVTDVRRLCRSDLVTELKISRKPVGSE